MTASGRPPQTVPGPSPWVADLAILAQMRAQGSLSEAEFAAAKAKLLLPAGGKAAAETERRALPRRVILLRHGESEGNADHTLYRTKPDNLIELTARGQKQALIAGQRIQAITGGGSIMMYTSPYVRTVQTARAVFSVVGEQVSGNHIEPRIREQEFGNLQDEGFSSLRRAQNQVGRFWYRFPTGESGADVYDRVKQWWHESVLRVNIRPGQQDVDTILVTTHGLTMRLILMQLQG